MSVYTTFVEMVVGMQAITTTPSASGRGSTPDRLSAPPTAHPTSGCSPKETPCTSACAGRLAAARASTAVFRPLPLIKKIRTMAGTRTELSARSHPPVAPRRGAAAAKATDSSRATRNHWACRVLSRARRRARARPWMEGGSGGPVGASTTPLVAAAAEGALSASVAAAVDWGGGGGASSSAAAASVAPAVTAAAAPAGCTMTPLRWSPLFPGLKRAIGELSGGRGGGAAGDDMTSPSLFFFFVSVVR